MMGHRTTFWTTTLLLAAGPALAAAAEMRFTGSARTDAGDLIYLEQHQVNGSCQEGVFRPQSHRIGYVKPESEAEFATKDLTYQDSVIRPAVDFRQPDFGETLRITYPSASNLTIDWRTPEGRERSFDVTFGQDLVVDAGFDTFVRRHWDSVLAGEAVPFRFLGPTRGEHYGFVLEPADSSRITAEQVLQIRPTGMVLRFLVDPIVLGYDGNGALTDYYGLTNIRKDEDTNHTAHIRYSVETWPDCELTP